MCLMGRLALVLSHESRQRGWIELLSYGAMHVSLAECTGQLNRPQETTYDRLLACPWSLTISCKD